MVTTTPARLLEIAAMRTGRTLEDVAAELGTVPQHERRPSVASRAVRTAHNAKIATGAEVAPGPAHVGAPPRKRQRVGKLREEFRQRSVMRGVPQFAPLDWSPESYRIARAVPTSGASASRAWRRLPAEYRRRVQLPALAMEPDEHGRMVATRTWEHPAARFVVALACVFLHEAHTTTRRGYAKIVQGRSRGMIAGLFLNPQTRKPYSVGRFFNDWNHDENDLWDCGHVVALRRARVVHSVQPPAECSDPAFVGVDRNGTPRALSQHWISERAVSPVAAPPMPDAAGFVHFVSLGLDVEHVDGPP